jgi:hypothetical protein
VSLSTENPLSRVLTLYRPYGPVFKPGEKAPFSGTYVCDRGTMLPPVRVQLTKGDSFPEDEGLSAHTRWHETNIQG